MWKRNLMVALTVGALAVAGAARAQEYKVDDPAAMSKALTGATVKLDQGIKASADQGTPISAKFELDEQGALQLSVYTAKGSDFFEVVVDPKTGTAKPGEKITDPGDRTAAKTQNDAMTKAKTTLEQAAAKAATDNSGYLVVAVMPTLDGTSPVANVTIMKDTEVKNTTEKLD
jgi:hypothetical protein